MAIEQMLEPPLAHSAAAAPDWRRVYAEQWPLVRNFFRYRVGDTAPVEALTARTFETASGGRHRYADDVSGFATWLLMIARHVAIEYVHAQRDGAGATAASVPPCNTRRADYARNAFDAGRLGAALPTLPPRQRELIAMRFGAAMSNRAIASATGLSETKVEAILQRAVHALRAGSQRETRTKRDRWHP